MGVYILCLLWHYCHQFGLNLSGAAGIYFPGGTIGILRHVYQMGGQAPVPGLDIWIDRFGGWFATLIPAGYPIRCDHRLCFWRHAVAVCRYKKGFAFTRLTVSKKIIPYLSAQAGNFLSVLVVSSIPGCHFAHGDYHVILGS